MYIYICTCISLSLSLPIYIYIYTYCSYTRASCSQQAHDLRPRTPRPLRDEPSNGGTPGPAPRSVNRKTKKGDGKWGGFSMCVK